MKDKTFRILALDGGGIKGIYTAKVLNELEKRYGNILDNFDLICGTSTGAIIALGLSNGKSAKEILDFYITYGPKIFPSNNFIVRKLYGLKQLFLSNKYSNASLQEGLEKLLHNSLIKDAKCKLCIPVVNLIDSQGMVIKTPHDPSLCRDGDLRMVDVGLATSAAPTFFPSYSIPNISNGLVDGGLWANNPAFVGAVEAVSYFVGQNKPYEKFSILSLSSISYNKEWYPRNHKSASLINWSTRLFPLTISVQSKAMDNLLKIAFSKGLFPMGDYIRIEEPYINPNQLKYIDLDNASDASIGVLTDLANCTVNKWLHKEEIRNFFNKPIG